MKQIKAILSICCSAVLFVACSSTDELEPVVQTGQQTDTEAISFDVYARGSQPSTRAGYVGEIDATTFQATGFGVYGYVSKNGSLWSTGGSGWIPDFMANQFVTYSGGWTYSPVKYWPNQAKTGSVGSPAGVDILGGGTATTDQNVDYVSFFAYAPYVESTNVPFYGKDGSTASTARALAAAVDGSAVKDGFNSDGILSLPGDDEEGDPKIAYLVPANPAYGVDLMYGVAARGYTANETTGQVGQPVEAGKPFKDLTKQVIGDKISYRFQHALTKLGINVDAYFDEVRDISHNNEVDANTRIVIEEISISASGQNLYRYGHLNLNNNAANTPSWDNLSVEVTNLNSMITNGLKLVPSTTVDAGLINIKDATPAQGAKYFSLQPLGVTKTKKSLFGNDISGKGNATLMLIPGSGNTTASAVSLTVKYHVITRDANLDNGVSDITNTITSNIGSIALKAGSQTIINLHLGMTTMKFDAQVADWDGSNVKEIDLPANVAVLSIDAETQTISEFGSIGLTSIKATYEGGHTQNLNIPDLYFTTDAAGLEILPVQEYTSVYYIPGNFKGSPKSIYVWYGGVSLGTPISQSPINANSNDGIKVVPTVTVGASGSDVIASGGQVTLTLNYNSGIKDEFNSSDWTVKQKIGSGEGDYTNSTVLSTDNDDKKFVVQIPANAADGAARTFNFKVVHKDGMELTATANQVAGPNYVAP